MGASLRFLVHFFCFQDLTGEFSGRKKAQLFDDPPE
jgi:hypothetical protein